MRRYRIGQCVTSWVLFALVTASCATSTRAAPLTAGNVLVAQRNSGMLTEFTPAGAAVQSFPFPDFEGGFRDLRDVIVGPDGSVHAFNGTFNPHLSTLVPATGAITSRNFPGWTTVNNISYGGIGALGDAVFVTDMATAGAPESGVVRFSTSGAPTTRFGPREYTDLTVGGDGLLYALGGGGIDVFNPATSALVRTIPTAGIGGGDVRGIAVAADGRIFAADWNGSVYAATSAGTPINSRPTGTSNLTDIDLNDLGQLLVGSRFGNVILTDTTLASQTSFTLPGGPTVHVGFVTPLSVPEPATAATVALAAGALALRRARAQVADCAGRARQAHRPRC